MPKVTRIPAAAFKARCLELMNRVRETRETYVITKHGRPIARLVAADDDRNHPPIFGAMAGTVIEFDGATDPIPGEWFAEPRATQPRQAAPAARRKAR
jgi:prevent-host-death family protein